VVNTASRLLECARSRNASLALSGAVVTATPAARRWADRVGLKPMAPQPLRGRAALEEVWVGERPDDRGGPAAAP
jgi:class 3 adenylate cyclase